MTNNSSGNHSRVNQFGMDLLAGCGASIIVKTISAPYDRVRLIVNTQGSDPRIKYGQIKPYKGIFDCFIRTAFPLKQGINKLWYGYGLSLYRYVPAQSLNFAFVELFTNTIHGSLELAGKKTFAMNVLCGALAGTASLLITYPFDFAPMVHQQWNYKGLGITLFAVIPYRGIYFGCFNTAAKSKTLRNQDGITKRLSIVALAGFSSLAAVLASFPFDTIRRRIILKQYPDIMSYKDMPRLINNMLEQEGIRSLFRGIHALPMRILSPAALLVLYDEVKGFI